MALQTPIFLQIYIDPSKIGALTDLLNTGGNPTNNGSFFPMEKIKSIHFSRWIIAPATEKFKASLIYSGNVDGSQEKHLEELVDVLTDGLDQILSHCVGFPLEDSRTRESRLNYLKNHAKSTPTFYVGAPERSVQQIEEEARFHEVVQTFVKKNKSQWKTTKEAYSAIKAHVSDDPQWENAKKNYSLPKKKGFKMILLLLLVAVLLPILILVILLIFLLYEWRLKPLGKTVNQIPLEKVKALQEQEDIIYQNQLSQVFETKSGLRKLFLHFILWATNFTAKNWAVEGQLMGTPTIHFARWVFIDNGKRFVFFSNFDGTYNGYLGDFVDNNGWGLNAIYGAAKGYPRTKFVFGGGSYKLLEFLGWGRDTQVPTPMWYSAYPWYGLQQIVSKSQLRSDLLNGQNESDEEMKNTLDRI